MKKHMDMKGLEALLAATGTVAFAKGNAIEELQNRIGKLLEDCDVIEATADAEKRDLTADERTEMKVKLEEVDGLEEDIALREKVEAKVVGRAAPNGRRSDPDGPEAQGGHRIVGVGQRSGMAGFKSFGHMLQAVHQAGVPQGHVDERLRNVQAAATTVASEGIGADGGYAAPEDVRTEIMSAITGEDTLISRTDQQQTAFNSTKLPTSEATPWGTSGIQAYWEGESDTFGQSKPKLKRQALDLDKLTALVPVTDELLDDAPGLESFIRSEVSKVFDFKLNFGIVQGTGAGMPLGILPSPGLVTIAKESGQAADTVIHQNIENMWGRLYAPYRANAVWLVNQDVETQFGLMSFKNTDAAGPAYLPPGGLNDSPYGRLKGRPVVATEACDTVGDLGDIILTDLSQYRTIMKVGGVKSDVSIHLWFDTGETAFRFVLRVAGQPKLSAPIARRSGSNTLSSMVTLAARA